MAYGGGTFMTQNKVLPGAYIVFSSVARASATISDRGVAAAPFELSWGPVGEVRLIEQGDFLKNCFDIFGYEYSSDAMLALREIFLHATKVYVYRLAAASATKAACAYATAKYAGVRGNDIRLVIDKNTDSSYTVVTMVGSRTVDEQTVTDWNDLKDNAWLDFKSDVAFGVGETEGVIYINASVAGINLAGGSDGTVAAGAHDDFLDVIEPYSFNTLCCPVAGEDTASRAIVRQYVNFTKRMRNDVGAAFQLVAFQPENADDEGVIGLWNTATHPEIDVDKSALTYWLTGAEAGCNINESLTNTRYDGELTIAVDKKQSQLEEHIERGHLVFHNSNGDIVVLTDINTFVTLTESHGAMFQKNQTIRVRDQIANDLAVLFIKRYLGIVQNDADGRASWWNDCVVYFREMQRLRAITEFDDQIVSVEIGNTKDTVLTTINGLNIVNAMEKLYMTVVCQ